MSVRHAFLRALGLYALYAVATPAAAPATPGWLLVCSDGLWNYCSPESDMGALVARMASAQAGDPLRTAGALVDWANAEGGMDNITVALTRLNPPPAA